MTATAAMQCLEKGLISLEDPVEKYLPTFGDAYLEEDGEKIPLKEPITIKHLLTMTAGLNYRCGAPVLREAIDRSGGFMTTGQLAQVLVGQPLDFEPGSRFQYSLCLDVMGAVIEVASGKTLEEFFRENIWQPLGMENTSFYQPGKLPEGMAAMYNYDEKTKTLQQSDWVKGPLDFPAGVYSGGAGLISTASDYIKFADALASGEKLLSKPYIDLMRSPQLSSYRHEDQFGCTCGPDYGYGLGVRTRTTFQQGVPSAIGEFGWDGAAGADVLIDPEHKLSFFYATHILGWPDMLGIVHLQIRDILYPVLGL
jgi:CubicO group peptidase (beta-lactamase class C family)